MSVVKRLGRVRKSCRAVIAAWPTVRSTGEHRADARAQGEGVMWMAADPFAATMTYIPVGPREGVKRKQRRRNESQDLLLPSRDLAISRSYDLTSSLAQHIHSAFANPRRYIFSPSRPPRTCGLWVQSATADIR